MTFFSNPLVTINESNSLNISIRIDGMLESAGLLQGVISVVAVEGTATKSKQLECLCMVGQSLHVPYSSTIFCSHRD